MKKFIYILVLFVCTPSFAGVVGKVAAIKGSASGIRGGKSMEWKINDQLHGGDVLYTGKDSLMLVFLNNGSTHKMGENSKLKLSGEGSPTILEIISGSLFSLFKKKKRKGAQYKIKTKTMVAGVRGTQFVTSYGRNKNPDDNWLCVNEGEVEVSLIGRKGLTSVKAGEGISVSKKGVSSPKPLPWTKKLNWSMDPKSDLVNKVNIESAYTDLLDVDYD